MRNWLISNEFSVLVAKIFETFGFGAGFEWILSYSKLSVTISNINLLVRNFQLRFRHRIWNYHHFWTYLSNGKPEIWGLWRHCHLIRIHKNIILIVVLVLNIAAQAYWFWFWFRIVKNKGIGFYFGFEWSQSCILVLISLFQTYLLLQLVTISTQNVQFRTALLFSLIFKNKL